MDDEAKRIQLKLASVLPSLNEKQRRLLAATEAKSYGFGGIQLISNITGLSRQTIYHGLFSVFANSKQSFSGPTNKYL